MACRLACLDRIYLFRSTPLTSGRKLIHYVIKGDTVRSDHFPVTSSILLEDSPCKACKWKMNSFLLDIASLEIIRIWQTQPPSTPFFKKLLKVLKFYNAFCRNHAESLMEDETDLKNDLEAATLALQCEPDNGDLHY
jgi:hypothetical protein